MIFLDILCLQCYDIIKISTEKTIQFILETNFWSDKEQLNIWYDGLLSKASKVV